MKRIIFILFALISLNLFAQKQTFDVISYIPPKGWSKETNEGVVSFTKTNNVKKTWCRVNIFKSTAGKGSIHSDYASEWAGLIEKNYKTSDTSQAGNITELKGWEVKTGVGKFTFNNAGAIAMLTTFSGFGRCASIAAITNSDIYLPEIEKLLASVDLKKPDPANPQPTPDKPVHPSAYTKNNYAFTTTNFDDGWVSTVQEDWVEVTKGNIKVLLHYPKEGTIVPGDPEPLTNNAWNILVAPRYSNLKNYKVVSPSLDYQRAYLGAGNATENKTGKQVYVALFRKGNSGWVEVIAPDKNTFVQYFLADVDMIRWDSNGDELFTALLKMPGYNRFAVAASDFAGVWTSDFTGLQQLYNVYTGYYAGMYVNQSNETFEFGKDNTYNWKILVVSGMAGAAKFAQTKSSGKFTVLNNRQISFSEIENRPRKYNAYFSCIKGARLLNLLDADYPGSGMYTVYGLKK